MNEIILTFDMDWATDPQIEYVLDKLDKYNLKSTWFVTHQTDILDRMKNNNNVELGIHPNFHPDSTQGKSYDEIMKYLMNIIPDAISVRTHTLFWSSRLMPLYQKYGIKNEASIILFNTGNIIPHELKSCNLRRFPSYWEDSLSLVERDYSINTNVKGLKIITFHPVHVFLNSYDLNLYKQMKKPNRSIRGIDNIFDEFISNSQKNDWCNYTLSELGEKYFE